MRLSKALIDEMLTAFARSASETLGRAAAESVIEGIRNFWHSLRAEDIDHAPTIDRNSISVYLRGGAFTVFVRQRVEAWALWRLSQMPAAQASALLEAAVRAAGTAGRSDIQGILFELVKHFHNQ